MLRQLRKNKRAQNTAEYALLIALVIAGIIAMQTYAQRSLQARMRDASLFMTSTNFNRDDPTKSLNQYEPYYLNSSYDVTRDSQSYKRLDSNTTAYDTGTNRERASGGYEKMMYNSAITTGH